MSEATPIVLSSDEGEFAQTQVGRLIKARGAETGGALSFTVVSLPQGFAGPPLHRHLRTAEAFYILEGSFRFRVDDKYCDVAPGGFVFVPIGTPHAFANTAGGKMLEMLFPADFEQYFREIGSIVARGGTREEIAAAQVRYGMEMLGPPIRGTDA